MKAPTNRATESLTIISRSLFRITEEDWSNPKNHFKRLRDHALELLLEVITPESKQVQWFEKRALLLFDCLLRIIDAPSISSADDFNTIRFQTLQTLFYGALGSERFIKNSQTSRFFLAHQFYTVLKRLKSITPVRLADHHQKSTGPIPEEFVLAFENLDFNDEQVRKLRPYYLITKSGIEYNVLLDDMVSVLGESFTNTFLDGLRSIAISKSKDSALRDFGTTFAKFVSHQATTHQPISPELLADPSFVHILLVNFMEFHFMKLVRRKTIVQEATLSSLQKLWSRYRIYWNSLAAQNIVAFPMNAFPSGNPKLLSDKSIGHRKVKTDTSGNTTIVTQKLITTVPLHITDEQATKLVFEQLKNDFNKVQTWLREHLNLFFDDYAAGQKLAAEVQDLPADDEVEQATRYNPSRYGWALAIKYFKEVHGGYNDTSRFQTLVYPDLGAGGRISKSGFDNRKLTRERRL
jgi:hypothetical protein